MILPYQKYLQALLLEFTPYSLPTVSQAQWLTVPKCTVMKATQALKDNLVDTEKEREYELLSVLALFTDTCGLAQSNLFTWVWRWLQKFGTLLLSAPDYLAWVQLIRSKKGMPTWQYWYWKEKVCKNAAWLKSNWQNWNCKAFSIGSVEFSSCCWKEASF